MGILCLHLFEQRQAVGPGQLILSQYSIESTLRHRRLKVLAPMDHQTLSMWVDLLDHLNELLSLRRAIINQQKSHGTLWHSPIGYSGWDVKPSQASVEQCINTTV